MKITFLFLVLAFSAFGQNGLTTKYTLKDGRVLEVFKEDIGPREVGAIQTQEAHELIVRKILLDGVKLDGDFIDVFSVKSTDSLEKIYFVINEGEGLHALHQLESSGGFSLVNYADNGELKIRSNTRIIPNSFRQVRMPVSGIENGIMLTYFEYINLSLKDDKIIQNKVARLLTDIPGAGGSYSMSSSDKGIGSGDLALEKQYNVQSQQAVEYLIAGDDIKFSAEELVNDYIFASMEQLAAKENAGKVTVISDEVDRIKRIQANSVIGMKDIKTAMVSNIESSIVFGRPMDMIILESQGSRLDVLLKSAARSLNGEFLSLDMRELTAQNVIDRSANLLSKTPQSVIKIENWEHASFEDRARIENFIKRGSISLVGEDAQGVSRSVQVSLKQASFVKTTRKLSNTIMDIFYDVSKEIEKKAVEAGWSDYKTHLEIQKELSVKMDRDYLMKKLSVKDVFSDKVLVESTAVKPVFPPTRYEFKKMIEKKIDDHLKLADNNVLEKKVSFINRKETIEAIVSLYNYRADGNFANRIIKVLENQISKVQIAEQLLPNRKTIKFKSNVKALLSLSCTGAYSKTPAY